MAIEPLFALFAIPHCRKDESVATRAVYVSLLVMIVVVIYNRNEEGV